MGVYINTSLASAIKNNKRRNTQRIEGNRYKALGFPCDKLVSVLFYITTGRELLMYIFNFQFYSVYIRDESRRNFSALNEKMSCFLVY